VELEKGGHSSAIDNGSGVYRPRTSSIWILRLLAELGRNETNAQFLYGDNKGAIALANNPAYHARTKHIDIQYHLIRECVENGVIKLSYGGHGS
jgi:hypothetical protein